ncbi:hypothetical protein [Mameliella sp.]|uniref:hypothetical protein n=1 Tax=Mameliella sp. TaxID=1924940 RepID=UPI003BA9C470
MLYAEPHLKPSEMPLLTGMSVDRLKDWRRVGVFDDGEGGSTIGSQQANGRWLYSMSDAVVLATMDALRNTRLDRATLLSFAKRMQPGIQKALGFDIEGAGLFAVFWLEDYEDRETGFDGYLTDNPREIHTVESTASFLFDLQLIAQQCLPLELHAALLSVRQKHNERASRLEGGGK